MRWSRHVLLVSFLIVSAAASAQGDLGSLFTARPGEARVELQTHAGVFSSGDVSGTDETLGLAEYGLGLRVPVLQDERQVLQLDLDVYDLALDDGLFAHGMRLPDDLGDVSAGVTYRRELDRGWTVGGTLRLGSASDELFGDADGAYLRGTGFLRIPDEDNAWLVLINADTRREWPVFPGVGYQWRFETGHYLALGLPFLATGGPITERLRFEASYFPLRNVRTALRYAVNDRVAPYLAFTWDTHYFALDDVDGEFDHLRFEDKRLAAGVALSLTERAQLDLEAGYAFGRRFSADDDWDFNNDTDIDLEDVGFLRASLQWRF